MNKPHIDRRMVFRLFAGTAATAILSSAHVAAAGDDLLATRRKVEAYSELYRVTHTFQAAWTRYARSVPGENGPTGREQRLNGLVVPDAAAAEIASAEQAIALQPAFAEADRAARALIHFYREAAPLMAEAAAFHATYVPRDDAGRAGQTWHRRLVPVMGFTIDARRDLFKATDAIRGELEQRELAVLEARGRDAAWHVRAATVEARKVRDVFPLSQGTLDTTKLSQQMDHFRQHAERCQRFAEANPGKLSVFERQPQTFITTMSRLQTQLAARPDPNTVTNQDILVALTAYAQITQFGDLFFKSAV